MVPVITPTDDELPMIPMKNVTATEINPIAEKNADKYPKTKPPISKVKQNRKCVRVGSVSPIMV